MAELPPTRRNAALAPGIVLIAAGAVFFLVEYFDLGSDVFVAVIGAAFLAAYAFRRDYGLLVAGGILTGLGFGIALQHRFPSGTVTLGLGLGFLAVYLIDRAVTRLDRWWPVVPGAILVVIAVFQFAGVRDAAGVVWPLLLIVTGLWLLLRPRLSR